MGNLYPCDKEGLKTMSLFSKLSPNQLMGRCCTHIVSALLVVANSGWEKLQQCYTILQVPCCSNFCGKCLKIVKYRKKKQSAKRLSGPEWVNPFLRGKTNCLCSRQLKQHSNKQNHSSVLQGLCPPSSTYTNFFLLRNHLCPNITCKKKKTI